ncbi:GAF domain-containing protein [Acaryochloris sp. CCMEE 5410]|uniref:GAF domain-containing protein n=1 Tax=Acaryochloris sp. CCMEE 5410 TaxID=310037 RepID=UPI0002483C39|nr:GAF domain-containing protein [Acaryochloris sp. CCMEE 5410]
MTHSSTPLDIDRAGQDDLSGNQDSSPSAVSIPPMQDLDAAEPTADPWNTQTETTVDEGVEEVTSGVTAQSSQSEHSTSTTSTQSSSWAVSPGPEKNKEVPFKAKAMSLALAVSMLPVLAVGTVTYFSGQLVQQQMTQERQAGNPDLQATERSIQQQLPSLLIGTGITAILAGAIAAWLAHRATTPILKAVQVSDEMLQQIRPGMVKPETAETDILSQLEHNIRSIEGYIPALLAQQDSEIEQLQMLKYITNKIRASLNEDDVLNTTVEEARKIIKADRVIVYGFDEDWYGTVIAESVIPGIAKALWAEIKDPCFAENYVEKYRAGRIQAINNVHEAGLTKCHLAQLEPFQVKANLVVPILREEKLFGLLIAHQCTQPRVWQESEINFFAQVASQVGFALDHARLLVQVDQANNNAMAHTQQAAQDYEMLQQRISQLSLESNSVVELFGTDANMAITNTQDQMHEIAEAADQIHVILNEITQTQEQVQIATQESQTGMTHTVDHLQSLSKLVETVDQSVHPLQQPTQQLGELIDLMGHVVSQVQLQAMNAALEAARSGAAGQSFAEIAEKVHGLSRQLDATLTDIKPLVSHIQTTTQSVGQEMASGKNAIAVDTQTLGSTQIKLAELNSLNQRVLDLVQQIAEVTTNQVELSVLGHKTLDHLANTTLSATTQSSQIAEAVHQLMATVNNDLNSEDSF